MATKTDKKNAIRQGIVDAAIVYSQNSFADYFIYLLEKIPQHMEDSDQSLSDDLLPWPPNLLKRIRK